MPNESIPTPEHPPRNLVTQNDLTTRTMEEADVPAFKIEQDAIAKDWDRLPDSKRAFSIEGARRWLASNPVSAKPYVVYGEGGKNRWYVYRDGTVKFSTHHARNPEMLEKAIALGFSLF